MEGYGVNIVLIGIPHGPPLRYKTGNADSRRFPSLSGYQRPQQRVFVVVDVDRIVCDLDMLGESPDVIPPIAALSKPEPSARFARQFPHGCAGEALMGRIFSAWFRSLRHRCVPDPVR